MVDEMTMRNAGRTRSGFVLSSGLVMGGRLTRASDAAIRIIEAAYAPIGAEKEWLGEILQSLDALGMGEWCGYTVSDGRPREIVRFTPEERREMETAGSIVPRPFYDATHVPSPPVDRAIRRIDRVAKALHTTRAELEAQQGFTFPKLTGVLGTNADASGAMLLIRGHVSLAPRTKRVLAEVAAHVAAAFRLRMRIASEPIGAADAVYEPSGKLLDGNEAAVASRAPLALAVKSIELARGKLRRMDPAEAVATWKALVAGRWTLVDHVERDGKRFVLAHKNETPSTIAGLREREAQVATLAALGHSDKHIAYELGLQSSTVATHLRRALLKLRLPDRRALVLTFGPLVRLRSFAPP